MLVIDDAEREIAGAQVPTPWRVGEGGTTDKYRQATVETLALLVWIKRFAEAELGEDKP